MKRSTCHHCESARATVLATWCVAPTATDDAKTLARRLCDDCANDLRRSAEPKNYRTGIHGVTIKPL